MSTATQESTTLPTKDVRRNRETRDWDAFVIHPDGEEVYLGSRKHSWDAEILCDEYMYELLMHQPPAPTVEIVRQQHAPTYGAGESVAITNGAFAGLAGFVVDRYAGGYRVAVGTQVAEVSADDLAPDPLTVLAEAEAELTDLQGDGVAVSQRLLRRIRAALLHDVHVVA